MSLTAAHRAGRTIGRTSAWIRRALVSREGDAPYPWTFRLTHGPVCHPSGDFPTDPSIGMLTPVSTGSTQPASVSNPPSTPWRLIVAVWTMYGLLLSAQLHVSGVLSGSTTYTWGRSLVLQMPQACAWALATPAIMWLGRRLPLEGPGWPSHVAVHLPISLGFVLAIDVGYAYLASVVLPPGPNTPPVLIRAERVFAAWALSDGLLYWMVLAVSYAAEHHRRLREREVAASELRTQLAQAELQALKMQIQPHFLFNALHTIGGLVRTGDSANAVKVVAGLGDLLRRILDEASQQEVSLEHELEFIRNYLTIEQVRFRDRLQVRVDVNPTLLAARVPHLVLQPLVENAVRHGIGQRISAGLVAVEARRSDDRLELIVRDDGPGLDDATRPGIGLSNVRDRLRRMYGLECSVDVANAPEGGVAARITLPLRIPAAPGSPA
jgi:two-component system LytT family sensor kinase